MNRNTSKPVVAILATHGFEEIELVSPANALAHAGIRTVIVSPTASQIRASNGPHQADWFDVDHTLKTASIEDFDALLIPGGLVHMDEMRRESAVVDFVRQFARAGKPVFAIGYAPQILISADVVRGRRLTTSRSIRTDLANAGAEIIENSVVTDGNFVTCRNPDDFALFNAEIVSMVWAGAREPVAA